MCQLTRAAFAVLLSLFFAQFSSAQMPSTLTVKEGVPLHIVLDHRASYSKAGGQLQGHLSQPVYALDQVAIPAGTKVLGRVAEVHSIAKQKRFDALLGGDFTPLREAQIEFYALVDKDGKEIPIQSSATPSNSAVVQMGSANERKGLWKVLKSDVKEKISSEKQSMEEMVHQSHKMERLKNAVVARLPYHPQVYEEGTKFVADLIVPVQMPATAPAMTIAATAQPIADTVLHARLASDLSSAKNKWGDVADAVLTEPVFGPDHKLMFLEGTHLIGSVTHAVPSKRWGRSGQLTFNFKQVELTSGEKIEMRGQLSSAEADRSANVAIDEEGNSRASEPRAKQLFPLALVMMAQAAGESDDDGMNGSGAGSPNHGVAAGGFGLLGRALALSSGSKYIAYGIGYYGAARSIYSGFIARGKDVVFPRNTQIDIKISSR